MYIVKTQCRMLHISLMNFNLVCYPSIFEYPILILAIVAIPRNMCSFQYYEGFVTVSQRTYFNDKAQLTHESAGDT